MQWIHITKEDILKKFQHATVVNFKLDHGSIDRRCYDEETVKLIMDSYAHADYVNIAVDGHKVFYVDEVRKLLNELYKEEISLSKFIEELNVKANRVTMNHPEPTGSGWISVDTPPEIGEYVLLQLDSSTVLMGRLMSNGWAATFTNCGESGVREREVKYWMNLPLPPKP